MSSKPASRQQPTTNPGIPRCWMHHTYHVVDEWRDRIVSELGCTPTVDAFATPGNERFPVYWTETDDAFSKNWATGGVLWINPPINGTPIPTSDGNAVVPFQLMTQVVDKLYSDQATAIVVAPEWQRMKWYGRLVNIAARTYRIPRRRVQLYCDINGRTFRQRSWHTMAFLVDPKLPRQDPPVKPSISVWPVIRWIEEVLLTPIQKKRLCRSYQQLLTGDLDANEARDGESSVLTDPIPAVTKHTPTNATEKKNPGAESAGEPAMPVVVGDQDTPGADPM